MTFERFPMVGSACSSAAAITTANLLVAREDDEVRIVCEAQKTLRSRGEQLLDGDLYRSQAENYIAGRLGQAAGLTLALV
jgi:hypothetical protein